MNKNFLPTIAWLGAAWFAMSVAAAAEDVEAFTEPYIQVAVPASELGVIAEILVQEGQQVRQHQVLAALDDDVLRASLAVAEAAKDAHGAKQSAENDVALRKAQLESYRQLQTDGNATPRELQRAENEYQQALNRLQSVQEDLEVRRLEYLRVKAQIEKRKIVAPVQGHVTAIVKTAGEFVSPSDSTVLHIAHLKSLKAVFAVPLAAATQLQTGDTAVVRVGAGDSPTRGEIEFVSPVADAESGTVRVKIRLPNAEGKLRSGVVCHWDLSTEPRGDQLAEREDRPRPKPTR